jgi:adenosine/AMP kinase
LLWNGELLSSLSVDGMADASIDSHGRGESMSIRLISVKVHIPSPPAVQVILGQAHFIKTVEDLHEALVTAVPGIKFGVAFCEASEPCLVRWSGTDQELIPLAQINALAIGAGHSFIVLLRDCFPINVLPVLRQVPEVCQIYCATANPVEVILVETEQGRGILGVVDGLFPKGIEAEADIVERKALLRRFGYKF